MEIGISWGCYKGLEINQQAELIAANGFQTTFLGGGNPKITEITAVLRRVGVRCENLHAPFSHVNDLWYPGSAGDEMLQELLDTADRCEAFEISVMVVHLSSGYFAPRINEIGYERFAKLMEYAKKCGVTVAYENQRLLANLAFMIEQFPEAGFCWDVGHEACFANGRRYMPLFGSRLSALHIHDNEKVSDADLHLIPYDGKIDFDRVAREIAESGYCGSIMLELCRNNSRYYDETTPEAYYRRAAKAAVRLKKAVEKYRS